MKSPPGILAVLATCGLFAWPGQAAFYTNTIQSFSFNPPTRTISVGDTVVWVNLDGVGHTVTGDTEEEPVCGPGFLYQGNTCTRTFDTVGTFIYHCEPHESMAGAIVVLPPDNVAPNVFIAAPADGARIIGPTNVLIRAAAIDPDGVVTNVTFFDGVTAVGSDNRAPFEASATLGLGRHLLTAIASDDSGAQAASFAVVITIEPPLRILSLSLGDHLVLTSQPTNHARVLAEYTTNLNAANWLALTVTSNRIVNGALETICGQPSGSPVFIRIRSP